MAFPATNMRLIDGLLRLAAIGNHLDPALKARQQGAPHLPDQDQVLAGVCPRNTGNRTGLAQIGRPLLGRLAGRQQPAFFLAATAVIITIKIFTFCSCRGTHRHQMQRRVKEAQPTSSLASILLSDDRCNAVIHALHRNRCEYPRGSYPPHPRNSAPGPRGRFQSSLSWSHLWRYRRERPFPHTQPSDQPM